MHTKSLIAAILAAGCMGTAAAAPLPPIVDPIFHLTIQPSIYETGFREVSQTELKACGTIVRNTASYRYWILASTDTGNTQYLMISGVVKDEPGAPWTDDTQGAFLELQNGACTPIDPLDQVFPYYQSYATDSIKIDKPVFINLAADAVQRYSHAFGSKAQFITMLNRQKKYPELSILKKALQAK